MHRLLALLAILMMPGLAAAQASKFTATGEVLTYDTEAGGEEGELAWEDVAELRRLLAANPAVTILSLNSGGGSISAGEDMALVVIDYQLDTRVDGECSSSCVTVFLAGKRRSMTRGSKIGLHSRWWAPEDVQAYYEEQKASENWDSPFEFGSWIYEDTQAEIHAGLTYLLDRGVDPAFAIRMHAPREDMWYPSRAELEQAGVLRE